MPTMQKVVVERAVLDSLPGLRVQLDILVEHKQTLDGKYTFTPRAEYLDTFLAAQFQPGKLPP